MSHLHESTGHGQPGPAPGASAGPPRDPSHRPGAAVGAAVLAFVEAAVLLLWTCAGLVGLAVVGLPVPAGEDLAVARVVVVVALVLALLWAALLVLGGLFLLRGTGRRLLLVTGWVETVLGAGLLALAAVASAVGLTGNGALSRLELALTVVPLGLCLLLPALRVVLAYRRTVRAWVAAPHRRSGGRVVGAVLAPMGALAVVGTVLALTAGAAPPTGSADAAGPAPTYQGDSDWGRTYYRGGQPIGPPAAGDQLYDAGYDADAGDCAAGAMDACDDLFEVAPVGGVYEWFGSSCAGRLDHESAGGCVAALGRVAD